MTLHTSTPFYATGYSDYVTASYEGARAFWDDDFVTTVRGAVKGNTANPVAANVFHDIFVGDDGGKFPPPASGKPVAGSGVCKITPATGSPVLRPALIMVVDDAEVMVQTDVAGTLSFLWFDVTYQGKAFTP